MLDYVVNTAAYAKNCINKQKPKMRCNGQCQVMKKIQEEERKEKEESERKAESNAQVLSSKSFFCHVQPVYKVVVKAISFEKKYPLTDISYSFFHPPQA